ncbi:hypothetical protein PENTCL1PPCAC_5388, partial [Pristionchus entomophagus]
DVEVESALSKRLAHHQRDLSKYGGQHSLLPVLAECAVDLGEMVGVGTGQDAQAGADIVDDGVLEPGHAEVQSLLVHVLRHAADSVEHDGA